MHDTNRRCLVRCCDKLYLRGRDILTTFTFDLLLEPLQLP